MNIGVIIQARMNSSRLPGKVLMKLPIQSEFTVLDQIISRIPKEFDYCIGTTTTHSDDIIFNSFDRAYRGSENDVLSRFYEIASLKKYDNIVRLTADNPCIDSSCLIKTVKYHIQSKADYTMSSGLPLGCNIEVFSFNALKLAYNSSTSLSEKEHVTLFMKNNPKIFKISTLNFSFVDDISNLRLTMDYPNDYALLNLLFSSLPVNFSLKQLQSFVKKNEWVKNINSNNEQKMP